MRVAARWGSSTVADNSAAPPLLTGGPPPLTGAPEGRQFARFGQPIAIAGEMSPHMKIQNNDSVSGSEPFFQENLPRRHGGNARLDQLSGGYWGGQWSQATPLYRTYPWRFSRQTRYYACFTPGWRRVNLPFKEVVTGWGCKKVRR